jgi:hypothetical protein
VTGVRDGMWRCASGYTGGRADRRSRPSREVALGMVSDWWVRGRGVGREREEALGARWCGMGVGASARGCEVGGNRLVAR